MALTFKEVAEILKIIDASECEELVLELEGTRLLVRRGAAVSVGAAPVIATQSAGAPDTTAPQPASAAASTGPVDGVPVRAPMVGTFFRGPSPDAPPFVEVGAQVKQGDPLCLIEVMKLYTTIEAPADGVVSAIPVEDAQLVEFDQVLFVIGTP